MISSESLARFASSSEAEPQPQAIAGFDLEAYLAKHHIRIVRRKPWHAHPGGLIFEVRECPFDPTHQNGSAAFTLLDGKPGFRCQHDGCKDRKIDHVFGLYARDGVVPAIVTQWPELISLERKIPEPIPQDCLPGWLGDMAHATAESTETPFDLAALLSLAVASSCVAGKAQITPEPGYFEPLNIYVAPAMESGNRKTAVFNRLLAPLVEWETLESQRIDPERKRILSERRTQELRIEKLRKKAGDAADSRALMQEVLQLERNLPEIPFLPRLFSEDVTPERLASLMQEQNGKMAIFSDEGGIFDMLSGRYSKGVPNLDLWLKGHSVSYLRVDRQDRNKPPIIIDRPHLTVAISPQPDVLQSLADKPGFRGRELLARFLYALPPSPIGHRTLVPRPIPIDVSDRYRNGICDLIEHRPAMTQTLRMSPAGYQAWKNFQRDLEREFREGGRLEMLRDWGGKLAGGTARLAGLYHMVLGASAREENVAATTMVAAIKLASSLISHAEVVFALMKRDPAVEDARRIISWMIRQGNAFFSARDCFRAHQGGFQRVDAMSPVLTLLEQHGYLRRISQQSSGGRPPSDVCEVNPILFGSGAFTNSREIREPRTADRSDKSGTSVTSVSDL